MCCYATGGLKVPWLHQQRRTAVVNWIEDRDSELPLSLAAGPVAGQPHPRHPSADAALGTPPMRRQERLSRLWRLRGGRGAPPGATRSR